MGFASRLAERNPNPEGRRWIFVAYDQLTDQVGPLARTNPQELGIVLVESPWKASQRPYHRQKLALILSNLRHFALEQAARGVAVRHVVSPGPYAQALGPLVGELGPIQLMEPAEYELRIDLAPLVETGALQVLPHEGWLSTPEQFAASQTGRGYRMDAFYRCMRKATGILMDRGKPRGGKYSYDPENRSAWKGEPEPPTPPVFPIDDCKREVAELIERHFSAHPGQVDLAGLPATAADARTAWEWARRECLPHFGPYEDAMSVCSSGLFHSRLSPLINLHRLLPRELVEDTAARTDLPLPSQEGFIRQILGWREFVRHIHRVTQGFRDLGPSRVGPGDGGYRVWTGTAWPAREPRAAGGADPGATPTGTGDPLPAAWWGVPSGLACLDSVVADVWREGWSHHITRLMVLGNLATLLGVSARDLTDWFWVAYIDAFDWVVEPNVLGMATYAAPGLMTTKPYVSGSAYIHKMSDYCRGCRFDPRRDCPITPMYWAFLDRHRSSLAGNARVAVVLSALEKRGEQRRRADREVYRVTRERLLAGQEVSPKDYLP